MNARLHEFYRLHHNVADQNANELSKEDDLLVAFTKRLPEDVYQQIRYVDSLNMNRLRSFLLNMELQEASSKNTRKDTAQLAGGSSSSGGPFGVACHNCGIIGHHATDCWKAGGGSAGQGTRSRNSGRSQSTNQGRRDSQYWECYRCGKEGHVRKNCPKSSRVSRTLLAAKYDEGEVAVAKFREAFRS